MTSAPPEPGGALRDAYAFTNEARLDVPSTVICASAPSEQVKEWIAEGYPFIAGLAELHDVSYVDLATNHWPMFSRPAELAGVIGDVARRSVSAAAPG